MDQDHHELCTESNEGQSSPCNTSDSVYPSHLSMTLSTEQKLKSMPYVIDVRTYKGLYYEGTQGDDNGGLKESEAHFSYQEAVERLDALRKGGKKARQRK